MTWRKDIVTAHDLKALEFPPINYIVEGLIAEGLSLLAGRPKVGKSWLALDICNAVARDEGTVLGNIPVLGGDVLYCALEDTPRRLQSRMRKLDWPRSGTWPERLTFATKWRKLDDGGINDIDEWSASVSTPRLCVLDTLAGVRPDRNQRDTTYDGDYKALLQAHRLANERRFALLVLTHTRKAEGGGDPLDAISGTLGQVGCADTGLVLARTGQGATLYVRGRDVEEQELAVSFSSVTCKWTALGDAAEVQRSDTRRRIMAALLKSKEPIGPKAIAKETGIDATTVRKRLSDMVEAGEAVKVRYGNYLHPDNLSLSPSQSSH